MFCDWVPIDSVLDCSLVSENPSPMVVPFLEEHPECISWEMLPGNPEAIPLIKDAIERNEKRVSHYNLSHNPAAMDLLLAAPEKIYWGPFFSNTAPEAIEIIEAMVESNGTIGRRQFHSENHQQDRSPIPYKPHKKYVYWVGLAGNHAAGHIVTQPQYTAQYDLCHWSALCHNHAQEAVDWILDEYARDPDSEKISWPSLCKNHHPVIMDLVRENLHRAHHMYLSANPAAIRILKDHPEIIDYWALARNSAAGDILERVFRDPVERRLRFPVLPEEGQYVSCRNIAKNPIIFLDPLLLSNYKNPFSEED